MKRASAALIIIGIAVLANSSILLAQTDEAANSPQATTDQIAQRCKVAQSNLKNRVRPQDLRIRVNRMQAYRYIAQRLDSFTKRLEHNNQSGATEMRHQTEQLTKSIDKFKSSYESYDLALTKAIDSKDCEQKPDDFRNLLESARVAKQTLEANNVKVQTVINPEAIQTVQTLHQNYLTAHNKSAGIKND